MKPIRNLLHFVFIIIVLAVVIVVLIHLFGNSIMKTGIETAATKTLNVGVSIDDLDLSILGGSVGLKNLVINNPPGYQHDKLLELGKARISVDIGSLLKDTVHIREIVFDGVNVVLEQKGITSNNIQDVIKSIPQGKPKPEAEKEPQKPGKKLHIDNLELKNITVNAKLLPIPGKADTVTLTLEPIQMTNLGSDNKLDVAALSVKILMAIARGIAKQGTGQLPEGITSGLTNTLNQAAEFGKTTAEESRKILEHGQKKSEELMEGVKDLLKPEKQKNTAPANP